MKHSKKVLLIVLPIVAVIAVVAVFFVMHGSLGDPLKTAYEDLKSDVMTESSGTTSDLIYDSDQHALYIRISTYSDVDAIFDTLDKDVSGRNIGTLQIDCSGQQDTDMLKEIDSRIGDLSFSKAEAVGVGTYIIQADTDHEWTKVLDKTDYLYLETLEGIDDYSSRQASRFSNVKMLQLYYNPLLKLDGISRFKNIDTLVLGGKLVTAADTELFAENSGSSGSSDNSDSSSGSGGTNSINTVSSDNSDNSDVTIEVSFYSTISTGFDELADLRDLKTVLIYPDLKYTLDTMGEELIVALQIAVPDVKVNPPEKEYSKSDLEDVSDIELSHTTKYTKDNVLGRMLSDEAKSCYKRGSDFKLKSGKAKLNGKSLIYSADSVSYRKGWSSSKKFYSGGRVLLQSQINDSSIKVPSKPGDYDTFVYVYPTFTYKGKYSSGTKAYSQTLYVQVFDMKNKIRYSPVKVGTEAPPQKMTYIKGYAPDKYSGRVSLTKVYSYLKGLDNK
jgi:hypothetical protein